MSHNPPLSAANPLSQTPSSTRDTNTPEQEHGTRLWDRRYVEAEIVNRQPMVISGIIGLDPT